MLRQKIVFLTKIRELNIKIKIVKNKKFDIKKATFFPLF